MDYGPLFAHQNFLKNIIELMAAKKREKANELNINNADKRVENY